MDEKIIIEGFQRMENNFQELKGDIKGIKTEIKEMKSDITGIKTELKEVKTDIGGMKTEISGIKTEIVGMKTEIGGIKTEIVGMKTEIGGIKTEIVGMKTEIKNLQQSLNHLTETVDFIKDNAVTQTEFTELKTDVEQFKLTTHAEFNKINSTMVTKDYLDEKLYEFKSEIIQETRTGEKRLERLAGVLVEEEVISPIQHQFVMNG